MRLLTVCFLPLAGANVCSKALLLSSLADSTSDNQTKPMQLISLVELAALVWSPPQLVGDLKDRRFLYQLGLIDICTHTTGSEPASQPGEHTKERKSLQSNFNLFMLMLSMCSRELLCGFSRSAVVVAGIALNCGPTGGNWPECATATGAILV